MDITWSGVSQTLAYYIPLQYIYDALELVLSFLFLQVFSSQALFAFQKYNMD